MALRTGTGFWVAVPRSMASAPTVARPTTMTNGRPGEPRGGAGRTCCLISRNWRATRILTSHCTGRSGPVPIQRHSLAGWTGFTRTIAKIFGDMGYAMQEDQNGPWLDGVYPTAINVDQQGRRAGEHWYIYRPKCVDARTSPSLTETPLDDLVIVGGQVQAGRFHAKWPSPSPLPHGR